MMQDVREYYFGDKRVGQKTTLEYVRMISDINFDYPDYKSMKMHIQHGKGNVFSLRYVMSILDSWRKYDQKKNFFHPILT